MSLTPSNIDSLKSSIYDNNSTDFSSISGDVTSVISDPIGSILNEALSKINNVSADVEAKINNLVDQAAQSSSGATSVQLINNSIVITTTNANEQVAEVQKAKILSSISSINNSINILQGSINTLSAINDIAQTLKIAADIEDAILSLNPFTGAAYNALKKGIKIVFLSSMMGQYSSIISQALAQNEQVLSNFIDQFTNLNVQIKISDQANSGSIIDSNTAQNMIAQDNLTTGSIDISSNTSNYINSAGRKFNLKVEPYGTGELIGRAYDALTNMIAAETAPSYVKKAADLQNELKTILN